MKTLSCREAGKNCDYIARGKTEEEVLKDAAKHGKKDHGMKDSDFTPEFQRQLRSLIKDKPVRAAS
jgi:predicted small metal-binding protein